MATLDELTQDADALNALQAEEIALLILHKLVAEDKRGNRSSLNNRYNFGMAYAAKSFANAIMEGWAWLEASGCIAHEPGSDSTFFVTRRGTELAESSDISAFTREQILPRHLLHPLIEQ